MYPNAPIKEGGPLQVRPQHTHVEKKRDAPHTGSGSIPTPTPRPKQETLQRKSLERKAVQAARKGSRGAARVELNRRGGKPTEEAVAQQLQHGRGRTKTKGRRGAASRAVGAEAAAAVGESGLVGGASKGTGLSVAGPRGGAFVGSASQRQTRAGSAAALKEKRGGGRRRRRRKNLPSDKH